jgi:hypothetical protein
MGLRNDLVLALAWSFLVSVHLAPLEESIVCPRDSFCDFFLDISIADSFDINDRTKSAPLHITASDYHYEEVDDRITEHCTSHSIDHVQCNRVRDLVLAEVEKRAPETACRRVHRGMFTMAPACSVFHVCSHFTMREDEMWSLAAMLASTPSVTSVNLANCDINDSGAAVLAALILQRGGTLAHLDLSNNTIGPAGAQVLALALQSNHTVLQTLVMTRNNIGEGGASALAESLIKNTGLLGLGLSRNSIGANGARALASALERNIDLQTLELSWNEIGASGATAIASALPTNTHLQTLVLGSNAIGQAGAFEFAKAVRGNEKLQQLFLWENGLTTPGAESIVRALQGNKGQLKLDNGLWGCPDCNEQGTLAYYPTLKSKKWDQFVSLGSSCEAAEALRSLGKRKAAYPFDWCRVTNPSIVLDILQHGDEAATMVISKEELGIDEGFDQSERHGLCPMFNTSFPPMLGQEHRIKVNHSNAYGQEFPHYNALSAPTVEAKMKRYYKRFWELLNSTTESVLFVKTAREQCYSSLARENKKKHYLQLQEAANHLQVKFPSLDFQVRCIYMAIAILST